MNPTISARLIASHRLFNLQSECPIQALHPSASLDQSPRHGISTSSHLINCRIFFLPPLPRYKHPDHAPSTKMMVDPFEVRMRFTAQLQHLNASVTSSQKAAHYALKYRDMDEDLHSCILEQLERVRPPTPSVQFNSHIRNQANHVLSFSPEQHEQPRQHHVLHRTILRHGHKRRPRALRSHDSTRHPPHR